MPFIPRTYARPHTFGDAGDFTKSEHLNFLLKIDEIWDDAKQKDVYIAHVDAAVQLIENQTARFEVLQDRNKDNYVTIAWINPCGIVTSDAGTDCDLSGPLIESDSQDYEFTLSQKVDFSVDEETARTNIFEVDEVVAKAMMKAIKELDEWWNMRILMRYHEFAGANAPVIAGVANPFTWDNANQTSNLPSANYDVKMMASLMKQQNLNNVSSAFFVDRGELFEPWWNAKIEKMNLDGAGDAERIKAIDLAFDMWGFNKAGLTESMFMLEQNAVCLVTYNRHGDKPEVLGGKVQQTRYTVPSKNLPGVKYDVFYQLSCVVVGETSRLIHTFRLKTYGDVFLNPKPCPITIGGTEYTPSGVYSYTKTA